MRQDVNAIRISSITIEGIMEIRITAFFRERPIKRPIFLENSKGPKNASVMLTYPNSKCISAR